MDTVVNSLKKQKFSCHAGKLFDILIANAAKNPQFGIIPFSEWNRIKQYI